MTFKKAYTIAIEKSEDFREFDSLIKSKAANDQHTPCFIFSIDGESVFYYGFDGVDVQNGKYTARRAQQLLDRDMVTII